MVDHLTVSGFQYEVPIRYHEGQELTAGEAAKLQREYKKVMDVWLRKKLKNGTSPEDAQAELDVYATQYNFGQRVAGVRRPKDPVSVLAFQKAQRDAREQFRQIGGKLKDITTGQINKIARKWVADPSKGYMQLAAKELKKSETARPHVDPDIAALYTQPR